jgi:AraC-like DNA-binding protein
VFTIIDRDGITRLEHTLGDRAAQSRHAAEFTLGCVVAITAQLTGAPVRPRRVELRHAAPTDVSAHLALFGCAPQFDAAVNALELDPEVLARTVTGADPALSAIILRHAEAVLATRPDPRASTVERVRHLLARTLGEGDATLAAVAAQLHMSERSLQRRLADEDRTFDAILDDLRRELALRYLADPLVSIAEIAFLLGYSEASAFHRAFKRWTGATPAEMRTRAA